MAKASEKQYLLMLDYMEKNGDIIHASNVLPDGRTIQYTRYRLAEKWLELSKLLNSVAEPGMEKDIEHWKKVWSDLKSSIRKKIKTNRNLTGQKILSVIEKRLFKILNRNTHKHKTKSLKEKDVEMAEEFDEQELDILLEDRDSLVLEDDLEDPLQDLKQEGDGAAHDELNALDADTVDAYEESSTLPEEPVISSGSDNAMQATSEESSDVKRRRKREEELHKLAVAEHMWALRTRREQHASAQQERAWKLKLLEAQHAAASLERERAQFQRDLAVLQLSRERMALHTPAPHKPDNFKKNIYVIVDKNKVQPQ